MNAAGCAGYVTLSQSGEEAEAQELSRRFGLAVLPRAGRAASALVAQLRAPLVVLSARAAVAHLPSAQPGEVVTHRGSLGMAELRFVRALRGEVDPLVRAAGLLPGERVLDATLGLAGDALLAAQATGARVVGLEADPVLAALAWATLRRQRGPLGEAAARIEVQRADHREALGALPAGSFEVVLLDPMFRMPARAAPSFALLRSRAERAELTASTLREARRVARRGVLVKDAFPGRELGRLGLRALPAARTARVLFGWAEALR